MQLGSSQSIQSSNPLGTSSTQRVNNLSRPSLNPDNEDDKAVEKQEMSEQRMLRELRARDREVRAHEAAHMAAGGSLVRGGPSYTYQRGPDGRAYAVGGEVKLDVSKVPNDPEATLEKAEQIRAAALAPADPSPQDLRVASNANQLAARARIEIAIQRREESQQAEAARAAENNQQTSTDSTVNGAPAATASLATSEPPAAAISAFMATAETEPAPVRFNQFV